MIPGILGTLLSGVTSGKAAASPQTFQLKGAGLDAVRDYRALLERQQTERTAAKSAMWAAIHAETGTQALAKADWKLDDEYLAQFGIAFVKTDGAVCDCGLCGGSNEPATEPPPADSAAPADSGEQPAAA